MPPIPVFPQTTYTDRFDCTNICGSCKPIVGEVELRETVTSNGLSDPMICQCPGIESRAAAAGAALLGIIRFPVLRYALNNISVPPG
ncbi:hypothetical protein J6590_007279 [Homalodisca vitripennis]|nr:hypothetical protein J6590_007279 [Homalodisca vitripennis]